MGAQLHTARQYGFAYSALAFSVAGFLVACLGWGLLSREATIMAVVVSLMGIVCLTGYAITVKNQPDD
ncbi:hypothetical protein COCCU_08570 [Corynebacterium occultum]|uniref:Uncharacterized protein n=1 Tax=Corynebacterium occultum TaxID=2675219 RepID=A0A6B8WMS8_9CORY|nr:hypothetical protein COCCU_08570 [Corynebacterium occultum]